MGENPDQLGPHAPPATMRAVRVVIADDAPLWRDAMARLLSAGGLDVVAHAGDAPALTEAVDRERPDVAVVDVRMPPAMTDDGLRAALWIRRSHPATRVVVLSQEVHVGVALELLAAGPGGVGYLLKDRVSSATELLDAVVRVAAGEPVIDPAVASALMRGTRAAQGPLADLSARELEVLALMAEGFSNEGVAARLGVATGTVEAHITAIIAGLGLRAGGHGNARVHAVLTFLRAGQR